MQKLWQSHVFTERRLTKQRCAYAIAFVALVFAAGFTQVNSKTIPLNALNEMQSRNVKTERVTYKGKEALRVTDTAPPTVGDGERLVILSKTEFQDGMIQV